LKFPSPWAPSFELRFEDEDDEGRDALFVLRTSPPRGRDDD